MRILHTGDLHLDSAFCAYGAKDAQKQREEGRRLFRRIFEYAKQEECQMILFSGDVFDSKFVSKESEELFYTLVDNCNIPVVIAPGNHDPYSENSFYSKAAERLGDKLAIFTTPELQIFDFDELGVSVFGYAFTSAVLSESPLDITNIPDDNGNIRIFCGHADLVSPVSRYAPVSLYALKKFGFDYAALGHIHNRAPSEDEEGRIRYCGFAQGRSFDELGEGGVWIVDVDRDNISCERKKLSESAFYILEVSVSGAFDDASLRAKLIESIKEQEYSAGTHLRVILVGDAEAKSSSELDALADEVQKELGLEYLQIKDETLPLLDGEYLERDSTLRGELYRTLKPKLLSADADERRVAIKALQIGLAAIEGKNVFGLYQ